MTVLTVERKGRNISWDDDHPKSAQIYKWLKYLSPGYVEYLLQFGCDPHCSACRDTRCENAGHGDDACAAFKYGEEW